jgi:hypothetical protein
MNLIWHGIVSNHFNTSCDSLDAGIDCSTDCKFRISAIDCSPGHHGPQKMLTLGGASQNS